MEMNHFPGHIQRPGVLTVEFAAQTQHQLSADPCFRTLPYGVRIRQPRHHRIRHASRQQPLKAGLQHAQLRFALAYFAAGCEQRGPVLVVIAINVTVCCLCVATFGSGQRCRSTAHSAL